MKYLERDEAITKICRGRKVLHLGCVGSTDRDCKDRVRLAKQSLHWSLSKIAKVVGIDYSAPVIREYQKRGIFNNILLGDVEKLHELAVSDKFEVVLIADIIEHLSNPGLMLEGIKPFCQANTKIVLTTPHAFGLPNYLRFVFNRFNEGAEHVMTLNIQNAQNLMKRHGYNVEEICTCYETYAKQHRILFRVGKSFLERFPKFGGTLFVLATPGWLQMELT